MPKNKRYKTYPFPFLASYSKDYKKSSFIIKSKYISSKGIIGIQVEYELNNSEISQLIKDGVVSVVAKVVCTTMGLSTTGVFKKGFTSIQFKFDSMDIDGDVEISAYLVANDDFTLENSDLSDDWMSESPVVQKNNVIGESNENVLSFSHVKSGSSKSIFKFTQQNTKIDGDPYSLNLDYDDCIEFRMGKRMYNQYTFLKQKGEKDFIHGVFIIPALAYILLQMKEPADAPEDEMNEFNQKHGNKKWYQILTDNYASAFQDSNPRFGTIPPIEAAQLLISKFAYINVLAAGVKKAKERN